MRALDPDNDDHWTPNGGPSLTVVSEAVGNPKLTRNDVNQFGWTRTQSRMAQNGGR